MRVGLSKELKFTGRLGRKICPTHKALVCVSNYETKVTEHKRIMSRTVPMLDNVNVPPDKSVGPSLPAVPSCISRLSSTAISNTLRVCTFFTLGTTRPAGVSIANPMLCAAYMYQSHTVTFLFPSDTVFTSHHTIYIYIYSFNNKKAVSAQLYIGRNTYK